MIAIFKKRPPGGGAGRGRCTRLALACCPGSRVGLWVAGRENRGWLASMIRRKGQRSGRRVAADARARGPRQAVTHGIPPGLVMIALLALAVRSAYLWEIQTIPFFDHAVGDAASYTAWAERIAGGDWIGGEAFYQAPAYPYFLAVTRLASRPCASHSR